MSLENNKGPENYPKKASEDIPQTIFSLEKVIQSPEDIESSISNSLNDISNSCDNFRNDTEAGLDKARKSLEVKDIYGVENETKVCAELAELDVRASGCAEEAASKIVEYAKKEGLPGNKILTWLKPFTRIAAAFAMAISVPSHDLEAKEAYSEVYRHGVLELNKKALTLSNETSRTYVEKKGLEKWVTLGGKEGSTFVVDNLQKMDSVLAEKPSKIIKNHTHPLKILKDVYGVFERKEPLFKLVSPPSFSDFQSAYLTSNHVKEMSPETKMEFNAVEHNGSWNYAVDSDSKFFKELDDFRGRLFDLFTDILSKEPKLKTRLLKDFEGKEEVDPRILDGTLFEQLLDPKYSLYHLVSKESHDRLELLLRKQPVSKDFEEMQKLENGGLLPMENIDITHVEGQEKIVKEQKRAIERYIKLGKRLGIHMKFTPIEEFKK